MFPSWRIAKVFGIDLFVHWTFWLLPAWVIFTREGSAEMLTLWMHMVLIVALFTCVVLHELGHALTARRFGIGTQSITLSPLGGVAQLERMSRNPWEEFCISIAGPLVNVVIAGILGVGLAVGLGVNPDLLDTALGHFLGVVLFLNIVMIVFNLLPAFPMDGGRVLRALLASSMGLLPGTRVAVAVGTVVAALIGAGGLLVLVNPWLLLIALFVIGAGHQELAMLEREERRRKRHEEEEAIPVILVPPTRLPTPSRHVTVWTWNPERGEWVH